MKPLNFFMKVMNGDFKKYLGIFHKKICAISFSKTSQYQFICACIVSSCVWKKSNGIYIYNQVGIYTQHIVLTRSLLSSVNQARVKGTWAYSWLRKSYSFLNTIALAHLLMQEFLNQKVKTSATSLKNFKNISAYYQLR